MNLDYPVLSLLTRDITGTFELADFETAGQDNISIIIIIIEDGLLLIWQRG